MEIRGLKGNEKSNGWRECNVYKGKEVIKSRWKQAMEKGNGTWKGKQGNGKLKEIQKLKQCN